MVRKRKKKSFFLKKAIVIVFVLVFIVSVLHLFKVSTKEKNEVAILGIESDLENQKDYIHEKKIYEANGYLHDTPSPLVQIYMEGVLGSDDRKKQTIESLEDTKKVYGLAYAYKITHDKKYLEKAVEFASAWAQTYVPTGNSIDESHLQPLFDGYSWIKDDISNADKKKIDQWLLSIAALEKKVIYHDDRDVNNWNSHRINIIGQIGYLTDTPEYIEYAILGFKQQINQNLNKDGSSFDFLTRDALHYHSYNLWPLLNLAKAAKLNGDAQNLYEHVAKSGSSLKKSVHFLYPYAMGEKIHPEFVNSKVDWDKNLISYSPDGSVSAWNPRSDLYLFELAYFFDESNLPVVQKLRNNYARYPSFEILLAEEQKNWAN
jgi:hypothetical protein